MTKFSVARTTSQPARALTSTRVKQISSKLSEAFGRGQRVRPVSRLPLRGPPSLGHLQESEPHDVHAQRIFQRIADFVVGQHSGRRFGQYQCDTVAKTDSKALHQCLQQNLARKSSDTIFRWRRVVQWREKWLLCESSTLLKESVSKTSANFNNFTCLYKSRHLRTKIVRYESNWSSASPFR